MGNVSGPPYGGHTNSQALADFPNRQFLEVAQQNDLKKVRRQGF